MRLVCQIDEFYKRKSIRDAGNKNHAIELTLFSGSAVPRRLKSRLVTSVVIYLCFAVEYL